MSQMTARALATATEQLAFVAPLGQPSDDACASGLGVTSVLLQRKRELSANEFRTGDAALAGREGQEPVVVARQGDRRRLLSGECHESNMTWRDTVCQGGSVRGPGATSAEAPAS